MIAMIHLLVVCFTVDLALSVQPQCDVAANLPKNAADIGSNEYDGTWYLTVATKDKLSTDNPCIVIRDSTWNSTRAQLSFEMYLDGGRSTTFEVEAWSTEDGHYENEFLENGVNVVSLNRKFLYSITSTNWDFQYSFKLPQIEEENEGIKDQDQAGSVEPGETSGYAEVKSTIFAVLGSPSYYLAYIQCLSTGWLINVYTREKSVSAELLLSIHNGLVEHDLSVALQFSRCGDVYGM